MASSGFFRGSTGPRGSGALPSGDRKTEAGRSPRAADSLPARVSCPAGLETFAISFRFLDGPDEIGLPEPAPRNSQAPGAAPDFLNLHFFFSFLFGELFRRISAIGRSFGIRTSPNSRSAHPVGEAGSPAPGTGITFDRRCSQEVSKIFSMSGSCRDVRWLRGA